MTNHTIPAEAFDAAVEALRTPEPPYRSQGVMTWEQIARTALEAAAPYMLAAILEDAADTAVTDGLVTAAEVIYDLRRHAKDLRPTT